MDKKHLNDAHYWFNYHDSWLADLAPTILLSEPEATTQTPLTVSNLALLDKAATAPSTSPDKTTLEDYKTNYIGGCMDLIQYALKKSGYNPTQVEDNNSNNETKYNQFINMISVSPFFELSFANTLKYDRKEKTWKDAIQTIAGIFEGRTDQNKTVITKGLESLADSATSHKNTQQTDTFFVQNALTEDTNAVTLYSYHSLITLEETKHKSSDSKQTQLHIRRLILHLRIDKSPSVYQLVYENTKDDARNWFSMNTPAGTSKQKLCLLLHNFQSRIICVNNRLFSF